MVLLPLPALVLGARGAAPPARLSAPTMPADRLSLVVVVTLRLLVLLLVLRAVGDHAGVAIGAMVKDVRCTGLVYVFFVLDLLLGALVLLTFGRRDRRPARRRASPAAR